MCKPENLKPNPMTQWKTQTADAKLALVRAINAQEPLTRFNPDTTAVQSLPLPFYGNALLLRFDKGLPRDVPLWYVQVGGDIVSLDGSVANIHTVNALAPIALSPETAAHYLKFRLYFADRVWMEGAVISAYQNGFKATARIIEKDGVFATTYDISSRGETVLEKKERTQTRGQPLPAQFDF